MNVHVQKSSRLNLHLRSQKGRMNEKLVFFKITIGIHHSSRSRSLESGEYPFIAFPTQSALTESCSTYYGPIMRKSIA